MYLTLAQETYPFISLQWIVGGDIETTFRFQAVEIVVLNLQ